MRGLRGPGSQGPAENSFWKNIKNFSSWFFVLFLGLWLKIDSRRYLLLFVTNLFLIKHLYIPYLKTFAISFLKVDLRSVKISLIQFLECCLEKYQLAFHWRTYNSGLFIKFAKIENILQLKNWLFLKFIRFVFTGLFVTWINPSQLRFIFMINFNLA